MLKKTFTTGLAWLWVAFLVLAIDRYSKIWVIHHLDFFEPVKILPFFNLTLTYNTGAAFNFLHSASGWQNYFFSTLAVVVSLIVLVWLAKLSRRDRWISIALCLVLAGALGNAWDRVLYGYVIDFLSFHLGAWHFAIFNLADSAICVGAAMMCWSWLTSSVKS